MPAFRDLADRQYAAGVREVNFATEPEAARHEINRWAAEQTNGLIPESLRQGEVHNKLRLILSNAVYFRGDWKWKFDKKQTAELPFETALGVATPVPTMRLAPPNSREVGWPFRESQGDDWRVVELPYAGNRLVMEVVLPKQRHGLQQIVAKLTAKDLDGCYDRWSRMTKVEMPMFKLETHYELHRPLDELGMHKAFGGGADFSGLTNEGLYIEGVSHAGYVKIDEVGTEAAAATHVRMPGVMSVPDPLFRIDQPFLFLIRDTLSGQILFMGRVVDPSK